MHGGDGETPHCIGVNAEGIILRTMTCNMKVTIREDGVGGECLGVWFRFEKIKYWMSSADALTLMLEVPLRRRHRRGGICSNSSECEGGDIEEAALDSLLKCRKRWASHSGMKEGNHFGIVVVVNDCVDRVGSRRGRRCQ